MSDDGEAPTSATAAATAPHDDGDHSEGWSDDEEGKPVKPAKISKKQYKKDRKDEEGRMFERGNFRDDVCGMLDATLKMGHSVVKGSGKALYVKASLSWPKGVSTGTSDVVVTSDDGGDVVWDHVYDGLLVYHKSGNVGNKFFRYPSLEVKVKQKGALKSKTVSSGEIHLSEIIPAMPESSDAASSTASGQEGSASDTSSSAPLPPASERKEVTIPLLTPSGNRQGELVFLVKFTPGRQEYKPR